MAEKSEKSSVKYIVNYKAVGDKIREKRSSMGFTQGMVSEKVNLSESFYGHIERGEKIPSIESLVKIAKCLNMSLDYLLLDSIDGGADEKLHIELDNLFKEKTPQQKGLLFNILKTLADNIENL